MKFLRSMDYLVEALGIISGIGIVIITIFNTMEPILRYVFNSPTKWALSLSTYIFIWIIFLGSAYSFKTKGHVRVEMFLEYAGKRHPLLKRATAFIGYSMALIYTFVLCWHGFTTMIDAYRWGWTTQSSFPIPDFIIFLAITLGAFLMSLTIIYILVHILKGDKYYLTGEGE